MEAPVTTTTFPERSIAPFIPHQLVKSRACDTIGRRADFALTTGDLLDSLLPLFPLEVVLFPGTPLPLHIFEPRYKAMIGECLAEHRTFGVVRALEQGLADVGCTAEIVTVVKEYPDGQMDIVTEGRQRFEVMRINQERSFLRAEVVMIEDNPGTTPPEATSRAVQLHSDLLTIAGAKQDLSAADPETVYRK